MQIHQLDKWHCSTHRLFDKMGQARSSIVRIPSEYHHDLQWSFQPIFFSMRIVGIDLTISASHSKFRRFGFLILTIFMLIFNVAATIVHHYEYEVPGNRETTTYWVTFLKKCTLTTSGILIPLILIPITVFKWELLWKKVCDLEHFMNFQNSVFLQLRKIAMCTSAMVIGFIVTVII